MRAAFNLTPNPVVLTAVGKMLLSQAIDVSDYDVVIAFCTVLAINGTNYTVRLMTGMSKDSEDGWVEVLNFGVQTLPNTFSARGDKLGKYLRWEVTTSGTLTGITFTVQGMLQGNS